MRDKKYRREVELYGLLEELAKKLANNECLVLMDFVRELKKSLWEVLRVAITPPGSEQEELIQASALSDLEKGNTFNYCIFELERFILEHPTLARILNIEEKIKKFKSP